MSHTHNKPTDTYKKIRGVEFTKGLDRQHIADIQEAFIRELSQRFERIRGAIRSKVGYEEDFFGLKADAITRSDQPRRQRFFAWLQNVVQQALDLGLSDRERRNGEHFSAQYLEGASIQGFNQATGQLKQIGVSIGNPDNERVRELIIEDLQGPDGRYIKPIRELEDVSEDMAAAINERLDEAFENGWNPKKTANKLTEEIRELERTRAATIARTETSFSASKQTVRRYAEAGVEGIAHVGRLTAADKDVCPWCRSIRDEVFTLDEFSGVRVLWRGQRWFIGVPAHPNCRCSPVPRPGIDGLESLDERLPTGAEVIATGLNIFDPQTV